MRDGTTVLGGPNVTSEALSFAEHAPSSKAPAMVASTNRRTELLINRKGRAMAFNITPGERPNRRDLR